MRSLNAIIEAAACRGRLVVQPRMGFASVEAMYGGLLAVKSGVGYGVGTITVDSFTRVGDMDAAKRALDNGEALNGFPIASHSAQSVTDMLSAILGEAFCVQVRHGSADPRKIFQAAADVGLTATEGGPVSYNLPYSRAPLAASVAAWDEATRFWAARAERHGVLTHLETFAGCMYGQMCPPDLLVSLSVLEAKFFTDRGVPEVSVSLAQGPSLDQDVGALIALDRLAERYLPSGQSYHTVFYTYMGLFPKTDRGAEALIRDSARVAQIGGAKRLIAKTAAEARGIPTVAENVEALNWARQSADAVLEGPSTDAFEWAAKIEQSAERILEAVLRRSEDVGTALQIAFGEGILDIPFGMHPDNLGLTRSAIDEDSGALVWSQTGNMPTTDGQGRTHIKSANNFHAALEFVRRRYDSADDTMEFKETST